MRLAALPFLFVLAASVPPAVAQPAVCYSVQRGDTARRLAARLTGSADNQYAPWFQVVDGRARIIPKSQHARIRPGWQVCVERPRMGAQPALVDGAGQVAIGSALRAAIGDAPPAAIGAAPVATRIEPPRPLIDPMMLRYGAAGLILVAALLAFLVVLEIVNERQAILDRMKAFGDRFVREFERPLFRDPVARRGSRQTAHHPVRSHLRLSPYRERMEILLAPHDGRTYPNLSDHRKNLEYDIDRVLHVVGNQPFKTGKLYGEGRWVVIPFSLRRSARS